MLAVVNKTFTCALTLIVCSKFLDVTHLFTLSGGLIISVSFLYALRFVLKVIAPNLSRLVGGATMKIPRYSNGPEEKTAQLPRTHGGRKDSIVIAFMGPTGAGKSSLIKALTGAEDIIIGHGLTSGDFFRNLSLGICLLTMKPHPRYNATVLFMRAQLSPSLIHLASMTALVWITILCKRFYHG
jgi:ABC transporter